MKKTPLERLACIAVFIMSGLSNTERFSMNFCFNFLSNNFLSSNNGNRFLITSNFFFQLFFPRKTIQSSSR